MQSAHLSWCDVGRGPTCITFISMRHPRTHRRARAQRGMTLGSLLWSLIAILVAIAAGVWVKDRLIGDADARIHVYNSDKRRDVSFIIRKKHKKEEGKEPERITIKPGRGYTYLVRHSGRYVIDVAAPIDLRLSKPAVRVQSDGEALDVLFDIGSQGSFYVVPRFFLPADFPRDERKQELARLKRVHPERAFRSKPKIVLPVRIDYGFDQPVPIVQMSRIGRPPSVSGLFTASGIAKKILGKFLRDMVEEERVVHYVLADRARYNRLAR